MLRDDFDFLLDCLDADDAAIRKAALARLREVAGAEANVDLDLNAEPQRRRALVNTLRQRLRNHKLAPSATPTGP